jgi:hypothetical protein
MMAVTPRNTSIPALPTGPKSMLSKAIPATKHRAIETITLSTSDNPFAELTLSLRTKLVGEAKRGPSIRIPRRRHLGPLAKAY